MCWLKGKRIVIIELKRYNEVRELLIGKAATGSQGHIGYWDRGWRVYVTMAAVCMGMKGMGMQAGHKGAIMHHFSMELLSTSDLGGGGVVAALCTE